MSTQQVEPRTAPRQHYRNHQDQYQEIQSQLEKVRHRFETTDQHTRRKMLHSAHRFAVLSIQTPVQIHEKAFTELEGLENPENSSALKKVNYWKQKIRYINHAATQTEAVDRAAHKLLEGNLDKAHRILVDNLKGLGTIKAAFTLAILGYTEKMCIDTNVQQITDTPDPYNGVIIQKYEDQSQEILDKYPVLSEELPPFMVQWVLFDAQRGTVTRHRPWFDAAL